MAGRATSNMPAFEAKHIPAPDSATKPDIISHFTNFLYNMTQRGPAPGNRAWPSLEERFGVHDRTDARLKLERADRDN